MRQPDFDLGALQEIAGQVLPGTGRPLVERAPAGVSTPVYRIERGGVTLYLRLAEDPEDDLSPDVLVHNLLRARGVLVPEIVHFEAFNPSLGRGLMVTTEIVGNPLSEEHRGVDVARVTRAAGRDLAVINGIEVDGFSWVRRDRPHATRLEAELPSLHRFVFDEIESHFAAIATFFNPGEIRLIRRAIRLWDVLPHADRGLLAHGDFDTTHIYHRDGEYTGIIDFGEIRGADRFYDLGHFALHDGKQLPDPLLPHLLAGYDEVFPLPPDHAERIPLWSLLIGIRALARSVGRANAATAQRHLTGAIQRAVVALP
jgi:aminoglycoside phosphotransferase (APT) family kinase protein